MRRSLITLVVVAVAVVFAAGQALAFQCPKLVAQITAAAATRYDATAADVKDKVAMVQRSEEHTSELQSLAYLVCRLLLEKKKNKKKISSHAINGEKEIERVYDHRDTH